MAGQVESNQWILKGGTETEFYGTLKFPESVFTLDLTEITKDENGETYEACNDLLFLSTSES